MKAFLPIGSVVRLKAGDCCLMVIGRQQLPEMMDRIWDYAGCPYPSGALSRGQMAFFDHADIAEVIHRGYEDEAEKTLQQELSWVDAYLEHHGGSKAAIETLTDRLPMATRRENEG